MPTAECDLLIIGGGPAGLSAAINGASEGLKVVLMDSGPTLGGQAARSSLIENYSGFPEGISGEDLLGRFVRQAARFNTDILCPQTAVSLRMDGKHRVVIADDESLFCAKMIILGIGLSYHRLGAPGIGPLMGRGILYGSPMIKPLQLEPCQITIVGGANSAGQAAMHLAENPLIKVRMIVRKTLETQMSTYLFERIGKTPNIEVIEGAEVIGVAGVEKLETVTLGWKDGRRETIPSDGLYIFIGAQPKTLWLKGTVAMDSKNFIMTGPKMIINGDWKESRDPLPFETSMPGVFACGDVRVGSVKRVGSAVGEGATALAMCHEYVHLQET